jgi:hypothetical protein
MKLDWQFSLYDFFGFLIPGAVMFSALAIGYWGFFLPHGVLEFVPLSVEGWVIVLGMSYLCGHLAQSVTNHLPLWNSDLKISYRGKVSWWSRDCPSTEAESEQQAKDLLALMLKSDWPKKPDSKSAIDLCDRFLVQAGKTGDREMYQHRRGFYRGISFAYLALSVALFIRIFTPSMVIRLPGVEHVVSVGELITLVSFFMLAAVSSLYRQVRFQRYLHQLSIYGFLLEARYHPVHEDVSA